MSDDHESIRRPRVDVGNDRVDHVSQRHRGHVDRPVAAAGKVNRQCGTRETSLDSLPDPPAEHGAVEEHEPDVVTGRRFAFVAQSMRVNVMSIHGCHTDWLYVRSHKAVIVLRSSITVSVDLTAPGTSADSGRAACATSPPPVNVHTPSSSTLARISVTLPSLSYARHANVPVPGSYSPMI